MESKELTKYYRKAVIIPGFIIVLAYIGFGIAKGIFGEEYHSEWLTDESVIFITIILVALNAIFIGVLTTPLFLNYKLKVRSNILISSLTWFLGPTIWIGYLLAKHYNYLTNFSHKLDGESIFVFSNTIPFIIGLIWTFTNFRQDLKIKDDSIK